MMPKIPGFLVQREVGKGGMGVVYQAVRESDERRVAIKLLPAHFANPTTARRFQREGRSLLNIRHPNIVEVYDVNCHEGAHYIVMEFLEGRPLSQLLRQSTRGLPLDLGRQLALDIARALEAIHTKGLIHRDLKPGNVIVSGEGRAKLLDFGLVQVEGLTMLTETGSLLGTPLYMSPEQCAGHPADHRSDIYSFGIVLFQILTGRVPFQSESVYELLDKHKNEAPEAPTKIRRDVPADLEQITLRCLEKKPEMRYQSVTQLLSDFEGADAASVGPEAEAILPAPVAKASPLASPRKRRSRSRAALFLFAVLGLGAAGYHYRDRLPREWLTSTFDRVEDWWREDDTASAETPPPLEEQVQAQFARVRRAEALYERGERQRDGLDFHGAYQSFSRAWTEYPHVRYLEALIDVGCALRRHEEVTKILEEATRRDPNLDPQGRLEQKIRDHR